MMINEKSLIQKAEAGDIEATKALAKYYDKKSGRRTKEPNLGESVSIKEFFANVNREEDEPSKEKAFKWFMKGAELGDSECMYETGYRIYDNIGCEKKTWPENGIEAFGWYLKSAQAGYVPAMRITAYMYGGLAVEKNEPESFRWYLKAAELGDKISAAEVAKCYAWGTGIDKNLAEADKWLATLNDEDYRDTIHELAKGNNPDKIMWLDRLIALDDPLAMKNKADLFAREKNFSAALELYIKAGKSKPGNYNTDILAEALVQAGNIYYTGDTGEQSFDKALKYYTMAARKKYIKAMVHCGKLLYERGEFDKAEKYFSQAATKRENFIFVNRINSVAREYMGHLKARQGNLKEAHHWYELAAEDPRNKRTTLKTADAYFYGDGVERDVWLALGRYEELAKYETNEYYFEAQTKLAWIYELGQQGLKRNLAAADKYWKKLPPECKPSRV